MYCIHCGVKLAQVQTICPLCGTKMVLPEEFQPEPPLYPENKYPKAEKRQLWPQGIIAAAFLLPMLIVVICDYQMGSLISWSGYVVGALLVAYVALGLPTWFRRPNPVIFVPCSFVAAGLYLLYIDLVTGGSWFLSFAFPVAGGLGVIATAVATLLKYVRRGKLFILGGATVALGGMCLLTEFLMTVTFEGFRFVGWSLYPLVVLAVLGGVLIFLGICRPAREVMERKTFL